MTKFWQVNGFYTAIFWPVLIQVVIFVALFVVNIYFPGPRLTLVTAATDDSVLSTFTLVNSNANAVDAKLLLEGRQPSIFANNGVAGLKLYQQSGRTDWVIDISEVPGRSIESFIIRDDLEIKNPSSVVLSSSVDLSFEDLNGRPRWVFPYYLLISAILYITISIIFTIIQHAETIKVEVKLTEVKKDIEESKNDAKVTDDKLVDLRQQVENTRSDLREAVKAERGRMAKYILYSRRALSLYARENEFWRLIFERIMTSAGADRSKARKMIGIIASHLAPRGGRKDVVEPEVDSNIDTALDVLTDELKGERLRELLGHK